jgi:hypothetical protein
VTVHLIQSKSIRCALELPDTPTLASSDVPRERYNNHHPSF